MVSHARLHSAGVGRLLLDHTHDRLERESLRERARERAVCAETVDLDRTRRVSSGGSSGSSSGGGGMRLCGVVGSAPRPWGENDMKAGTSRPATTEEREREGLFGGVCTVHAHTYYVRSRTEFLFCHYLPEKARPSSISPSFLPSFTRASRFVAVFCFCNKLPPHNIT